MVLTRTQILSVEKWSGTKLKLELYHEDIKDTATEICEDIYKLIDTQTIDHISPSFLKRILGTLDLLNKTIKSKAEKSKLIDELRTILANTNEQYEHIEKQLQQQKKFNEDLINESEKTIEENDKLKNSIIDNLTAQLQSKTREIAQLRKDISKMKEVQSSLRQSEPEKSIQQNTLDSSLESGNSTVIQLPDNDSIGNSQDIEPSNSNEKQSAEPQLSSDQSNINIKKEYRKVFVIGDSHCRNVDTIFQKLIPRGCNAKTLCKPGFKLDGIVNSIDPDKIGENTLTCIIAGTNDIFKTKWENMQKSLDTLSAKLKNRNVLFVLTPPRYDIRKINKHIVNLNTRIKHYLSKQKNCTTLNSHNFLNVNDYCQDMVHLNLKGKNTLFSRIIKHAFGKMNRQQVYHDKSRQEHNYNFTNYSSIRPQYVDGYEQNQTRIHYNNQTRNNYLHQQSNKSEPFTPNFQINQYQTPTLITKSSPPSYRDILMKEALRPTRTYHSAIYTIHQNNKNLKSNNRFAPLQYNPNFCHTMTTLV